MKNVALYLRVSTSEQTTKNQRRELTAVAKRHGWHVAEVFEDAGVSGAKGRAQRPGLDALLKGVARREFDLVVAWSVDRLGRSLQDLLGVLQELQAKRIDLYLHQQGIDTTTPAGRAFYSVLGTFAEFERSLIQERIKSGLARAKAEGRRLGRPRVGVEVEAAILRERASGKGMRRVARDLKVGVSVVQRVLSTSRRKQGRSRPASG